MVHFHLEHAHFLSLSVLSYISNLEGIISCICSLLLTHGEHRIASLKENSPHEDGTELVEKLFAQDPKTAGSAGVTLELHISEQYFFQ